MSRSRSLFTWIIIISVIIQGCGVTRKSSEDTLPQPDWVKSRPITPGYYTGIGWAKKTQNVHHYQQTARQNALADLAGGISVTISTNSVIHAFESNLGFREDFSSTIIARTQEDLEGYEIVDSWEDDNNYWVYYRLPVTRHQQVTAEKKARAARLSAGHLDNALESRREGRIRHSLVQLINSMEAIRNYLDEPVQVEFRGDNVLLGNHIFNELSNTISRIEITPVHSLLEAKTGSGIPSSRLKFRVTDQSGNPVSNFPLRAEYTERPLRNNTANTGRDGLAEFGIEVVRSVRSFETFTVRADMELIISEATSDPVIRRLSRQLGVPEANVRINILPPVLKVVTKEENTGNLPPQRSLGETFRRLAIDAGYIINHDSADADYIIRIKAFTKSSGETGIYHNALLNGTISVEQPDGNVVYFRELDSFRGSHFEKERAGEEAFIQAGRRIESSYFREIDEIIRKRVFR